MLTKNNMNEFLINHKKFQHLSDVAQDWFVKSFKYPENSEEFQICRLKRKMYMREAMKYLKEANKWIQ